MQRKRQGCVLACIPWGHGPLGSWSISGWRSTMGTCSPQLSFSWWGGAGGAVDLSYGPPSRDTSPGSQGTCPTGQTFLFPKALPTLYMCHLAITMPTKRKCCLFLSLLSPKFSPRILSLLFYSFPSLRLFKQFPDSHWSEVIINWFPPVWIRRRKK